MLKLLLKLLPTLGLIPIAANKDTASVGIGPADFFAFSHIIFAKKCPSSFSSLFLGFYLDENSAGLAKGVC